MDRVELEDKCHQVFEENQLLKKHAKAQEEKMKKFVSLTTISYTSMGVVKYWFCYSLPPVILASILLQMGSVLSPLQETACTQLRVCFGSLTLSGTLLLAVPL